MRIIWDISADDVTRVQFLLERYKDDAFVADRVRKNLATNKPPVKDEVVWYWIVGCLLTTQQRAGPHSAVTRLQNTKPFPFRLTRCRDETDLAGTAIAELTAFGGIRRARILGGEFQHNLKWLDGGGWERLLPMLDRLRDADDPAIERATADFIDDHLRGFGPKQSRNLLQCLGLSKYEIPIDSRITKWLNGFGFPVRLSADMLGSRHYYAFVSDGFQTLCKAAGVYPCVLDAAVFTSFDNGGWTKEILAS